MEEKKTPPKPSVNLKNAAQEIGAIIDKYDLSGVCTLYEPVSEPSFNLVGFCERVYKIGPSWSCVKLDNAQKQLRVVQPLDDGKGSRENTVKATINMLANLAAHTDQTVNALKIGVGNVQKVFGIKAIVKPIDNGEVRKN